MLYVYDNLCYICLLSGLDLFGDVYKRVDWDAGAAGVYFVYFHDKTGSCRTDFKNERKLRQKKKKFEESKKDDDGRSNQPQLEESSEDAQERCVDANFESCLKFCYWLRNTGFISSLAFLFLNILCFPIITGTCFWGVLQSFAISKFLQITLLIFLLVFNSLLNTGLVSAISIA